MACGFIKKYKRKFNLRLNGILHGRFDASFPLAVCSLHTYIHAMPYYSAPNDIIIKLQE